MALPVFVAGLAASPFAPEEPVVIRNSSGAGQKFRTASLRPSYGRRGGALATGAKPLSLASTDLNSDGYPDLVAGYATSRGGLIAVHFANPEAFAPSTPESLAGAARGDFQPSFGGAALTIPVAAAPDLLAAGDFNEDGHADVIFAPKGGDRLYILAGDGHGAFASPLAVAMSGVITAMTRAPARR